MDEAASRRTDLRLTNVWCMGSWSSGTEKISHVLQHMAMGICAQTNDLSRSSELDSVWISVSGIQGEVI